MDDVEHELIQAWRRCSLASPPYLLPGDEVNLPRKILTVHQLSHVDPHAPAIHSTDTTLHVGLLPAPYNGNLIRASIFVLMLNPGLAPGDYPAEYAAQDYRATAIRQPRQENGGDDYPSLFLDPRFKWHPGFTYWQKRGFRKLAERLAVKDRIPLNAALSRLSQSISCLQLVPYHSKTLQRYSQVLIRGR